MRWGFASVAGLMVTLAMGPATPCFAGRIALLVGVGAYQHLPPEAQLQGPASDVAAFKDVLVRRWGFAASDVRTLVDAKATKSAILAELKALKQRSKEGDEIVYYVSGHGTSAYDAGARLPLPQGSGAFLPYDANPGGAKPLASLLVGETDLQPILRDLEKAGRRVWAISDSCYSGQQVRSAVFAQDLPSRHVPMAAPDQREDLALAGQAARIDPYPYTAVSYLAASAEGERARDIPPAALKAFPTFDGKPHGAFTDALLRVLEGQLPGDMDGDGFMSLSEVHRAVSDFMAGRGYGHTPQRLPSLQDDAQGLGKQPVLRVSRAATASAKQPPQPLRVWRHPSLALDAKVVETLGDVAVAGSQAGADIALTPAPGQRSHLALRTAAGDLIALVPTGDARGDQAVQALRPLQAQLRQLAWSHRLRQLAMAGSRGVLEAEIQPAQMGGNFLAGQLIGFDLKPDREAHLLVLNINADGLVSVLYPANRNELRAARAGRLFELGRIRTQPPYGMDQQLLLAFDEPLPQGETWLIPEALDPADGRIARLESLLARQAGRYTFASTELRVLPPAAQGGPR